ncbi:MAG TPA: hypothetical protein VNO50_10380 [Pyrinomonadaceae bacterium]|nr:hypothetical protein [Pyrinomonadaceae bacterium]
MPLTINDDKVWYDEARKLEQICLHVSDVSNRGQSLLLLSHFESALGFLSRVLREKGIEHERSALNLAELGAGRPAKVWLSHARAFSTAIQLTSTDEKSSLDIIVAEHHPMHSRDRELIASAADLDCDASLTFYFSLDDPLMKYFGSDSIKTLFQRLGMAQDECISHPLVSKAIRQAQEKIEQTVGRDLAAQSAEDWFKYNLPKTKDY